ncbi:methionyl-tRNA formyltransferase [bacterium]|nr:methionyl-tRNA formyltransferase [bacterium]
MKKIVVFGCQQIAVDFIRYVVTQSNIHIALIVTYELPLDKTYGYESVIERFSNSEIEVLSPSKITKSLIDKVRDISPDYIFSIYYRKILPKSLLSAARYSSINIHPSLLPQYRGPVPTAWTIENGEKDFGITIHLMDEGIDTGDILVQEKYPVIENETGFELYSRGMKLGFELLKNNLSEIINDKITPKPQIGIGSYYGKKSGKHTISWQDTAEKINNKIRIHSIPYNPAESSLFNRYIFINKATPTYDKKYIPQGCGKIVDIIDNDKLVISCADGCLILDDYKIMPELDENEKDIYFRIGNILGI